MSSGHTGTTGTTSVAPTRGCAPSWRRRSIRPFASSIPPKSESTSSASEPTSVKTDRLWSASAWTSSSRACAPSAAPIASIVSRLRPSEKFGTDSSGSTALLYEPMKAYYDARAREYDDWIHGVGVYADRTRPGWTDELDAAAGSGYFTRFLPGHVVALDQSANMLEVANERETANEYVLGDALDLPFEDGSFARVFTGHFYGHLADEERQRFSTA